tara:strand:- start:714 stop:815 length:102 start_codon:yes stop_codon:yes gene_type:complete
MRSCFSPYYFSLVLIFGIEKMKNEKVMATSFNK